MKKLISAKKQFLIDSFNEKPLKKGEEIYVFRYAVDSFCTDVKKKEAILCEIMGFDKDLILVNRKDYNYNEISKIKKSDIAERYILKVGANPIDEKRDNIRSLSYSIESILHTLGVIDGDYKENYH